MENIVLIVGLSAGDIAICFLRISGISRTKVLSGAKNASKEREK
jgi:hypothetical protein